MLWFGGEAGPGKTLAGLVAGAQRADLRLAGSNAQHERSDCRYREVFAAVAGACRWKRIDGHPFYGYDLRRGEWVPWSVELWSSYAFEH
jgi:hypothetical protein